MEEQIAPVPLNESESLIGHNLLNLTLRHLAHSLPHSALKPSSHTACGCGRSDRIRHPEKFRSVRHHDGDDLSSNTLSYSYRGGRGRPSASVGKIQSNLLGNCPDIFEFPDGRESTTDNGESSILNFEISVLRANQAFIMNVCLQVGCWSSRPRSRPHSPRHGREGPLGNARQTTDLRAASCPRHGLCRCRCRYRTPGRRS